jgi:glycosyltransferase involved in cell wall biosynthesis
MNGIPRFSVVITCYNKAPTIERAIRSACAQGPDVEVIVVDDDSTDGSRAILEKLDGQQIRLIAMERNGGPLLASLRGLRAATGQYIAMLDGDDILVEGVLPQLSDIGLLDDDSLIMLKRKPFLDDPGQIVLPKSVKRGWCFRPGYLFVVSQSTGGISIVAPRTLFTMVDGNWPDIHIQDHVIPGALALEAKQVVRTASVGYLADATATVSHVSSNRRQMAQDRLAAEAFFIARGRLNRLPVWAVAILRLLRRWRIRRYRSRGLIS